MTRKGAKQPGENTDEVSQAVRQLKALCQDLIVLFHAVSHRNMLKIKILVCLNMLQEMVSSISNGKMTFVSVLFKYLETGNNLKEITYSSDMYFCERHFVKEDMSLQVCWLAILFQSYFYVTILFSPKIFFK